MPEKTYLRRKILNQIFNQTRGHRSKKHLHLIFWRASAAFEHPRARGVLGSFSEPGVSVPHYKPNEETKKIKKRANEWGIFELSPSESPRKAQESRPSWILSNFSKVAYGLSRGRSDTVSLYKYGLRNSTRETVEN